MIKVLKLFQSFVHRILILASVVVVHGCGEVKVVQNPSPLTTIDPLTEVVSVDILDPKVRELECIRITDDLGTGSQNLSPEDRVVFIKALTAHTAPLNYPTAATCGNTIQIKVTEYNVNNLVFASRLVVAVHGEVRSVDGDILWSARYRLSENAGSLPFDPISIGFGVASAAQNSSEDSRHNGAYLAVRRLLRALPEHSGLVVAAVDRELSRATNGDAIENLLNKKTYTEAMTLWEQEKFDDALTIMEDIYADRTRVTIGYQYGLMLEATGKYNRAAEVYADTAVAQAEIRQPTLALKTLRRLERLNESNQSAHDSKLNRAVQVISELLER